MNLRIILAMAAVSVSAGVARAAVPFVPRQMVVSLEAGYSIEKIDEMNGRYGTSTLDAWPEGDLYLLYVPAGTDPDSLSHVCELDPAVAFAEPNYYQRTMEAIRQMVISATDYTYEEYADQSIFSRIGLGAAQQVSLGAHVTVAVLDTGIDPGHPAFTGRLADSSYDFVDSDNDPTETANGIDDDGDGTIDGGYGHGTMVAGIVAAVAPQARILPVRVLDDEGRGDAYHVSKAIRYAVDHGAKVINMSFGIPQFMDDIERQLEYADQMGVVLVSGAGNENRMVPGYFPGTSPLSLMIAALDSNDVKAGFSDFHLHVTVSAPGVAVLSAYPQDRWASGSGCSFAAPFVAGEAALVFGLNLGASVNEVKSAIRGAVVPIYSIPGNARFFGLLGTGRIFLPLAVGIEADVSAKRLAGADGGLGLQLLPNPAHGAVVLRAVGHGTPADGLAASIYDVSGRAVCRLHGARDADLVWDGRDARGRLAAAGIYFVRLTDGSRSATSTLILDR